MVKRETKSKEKQKRDAPKSHYKGHVREKKAMVKGKKKKNDAFPDFVKKPKRKVGKKKLLPAKAINPVVRSKGIVVPSFDKPKPEPGQSRTAKGQTLNDILPKLGHYNLNVRRDALHGITALAATQTDTGAPVITSSLVGAVLTKAMACILDEDPEVRRALLTALKAVFSLDFGKERFAPFIPVILRYVNMALTHVLPGVQKSGVDLLGAFLSIYGAQLTHKDLMHQEGAQVLCSLVKFSHCEYTLQGRKTTGAMQVLDVLVALLHVRLRGDVRDARAHTPVDYATFLDGLPNNDPLLLGSSSDGLQGLQAASKKGKGRYKAAQAPPTVAEALPDLTAVTSTPEYFHLLSEGDRLRFFDDVAAVAQARVLELNPAGRRGRESGSAASVFAETGYLALALNSAIALVCGARQVWSVARAEDVAQTLGPDRRLFIVKTFLRCLPLEQPIGRGSETQRLHATLQLCLLGSLFVPRRQGSKQLLHHTSQRWYFALAEEVMRILEDEDADSLSAFCAPCACLPACNVKCVTILVVVAERLMMFLPATQAQALSHALLQLFIKSPPNSIVKQECVTFLRHYLDHSVERFRLESSRWFDEWVRVLPRLLWELRLQDCPEMQRDILSILRLVLNVFYHVEPAEDSNDKAKERQVKAVATRQGLQSALVKSIWMARLNRPETEAVQTVSGCFVHVPPDIQMQCIELLYYYKFSGLEGLEAPDAQPAPSEQARALMEGIIAILPQCTLEASVLVQVVEAVRLHCSALDLPCYVKTLLVLLQACKGPDRSRVAQVVACALSVAAGQHTDVWALVREQLQEMPDQGGSLSTVLLNYMTPQADAAVALP